MHEQEKIDEAARALGRMQADMCDPTAFRDHFSAFITAARSALQYAHKEASPKAGGQNWFDTQVASRPLVRFFKDKRDTNIHVRPTPPTTNADARIGQTARLSEVVTVQKTTDEGVSEPPMTREIPSTVPDAAPQASVTYSYTFDDRPEDVLTLCSSYLTEIRSAVADGVARGFVTG